MRLCARKGFCELACGVRTRTLPEGKGFSVSPPFPLQALSSEMHQLPFLLPFHAPSLGPSPSLFGTPLQSVPLPLWPCNAGFSGLCAPSGLLLRPLLPSCTTHLLGCFLVCRASPPPRNGLSEGQRGFSILMSPEVLPQSGSTPLGTCGHARRHLGAS